MALSEVMLSEAFLQLLENAPAEKEFLLELATMMASLRHDQELMVSFLLGTELRLIGDTWERLARFARAVCLVFAHNVPEVTAAPSDLFYFLEYRGSNLFDRAVRNVLTKNPWWKKMSEEVAKVAGSKPMLQPKIESLSALLERIEGSPGSSTSQQLQDLGCLFEEVQPGLRGQEISDFVARSSAAVVATARAVQSNGDLSAVSAATVDAVSMLLQKFCDQAGVPSVLDEFTKWANQAQEHLVSNALIEKMNAATRTEIDFAATKALVEKVSPKVLAKKLDFLPGVFNLVHKGLLLLADKAC